MFGLNWLTIPKSDVRSKSYFRHVRLLVFLMVLTSAQAPDAEGQQMPEQGQPIQKHGKGEKTCFPKQCSNMEPGFARLVALPLCGSAIEDRPLFLSRSQRPALTALLQVQRGPAEN